MNAGSFTITNGTGGIMPRPDVNGTKMYVVNGTLSAYNHTNWVPGSHPTSTDRGKDYHFYYNWITGQHLKITTRINATTGEHQIIRVESRLLSLNTTPESELREEESAMLENSFPD